MNDEQYIRELEDLALMSVDTVCGYKGYEPECRPHIWVASSLRDEYPIAAAP